LVLEAKERPELRDSNGEVAIREGSRDLPELRLKPHAL
jgi:hypothetical protein